MGGGEEKEMSERAWGLRENLRLQRKVGEDEPPHPAARRSPPPSFGAESAGAAALPPPGGAVIDRGCVRILAEYK